MDSHLALAVLNAMPIQAAVLDANGVIVAVNQAWRTFGANNGTSDPHRQWEGVNYLDACTTTADADDSSVDLAAAGIQSVLSGRRLQYHLEYPCHSPHEQRWFLMRAVSLSDQGQYAGYVLVTHQNMTDLWLAQANSASTLSAESAPAVSSMNLLLRRWTLLWSSALARQDTLHALLVECQEMRTNTPSNLQRHEKKGVLGIEERVRLAAYQLGAFVSRYDNQGLVVLPRTTSLTHARELAKHLKLATAGTEQYRQASHAVNISDHCSVHPLSILPSHGATPEATLHHHIATARKT